MKETDRAEKKPYITPCLTIHGTVAEITKALGESSASDSLIFGRLTFNHPLLTGSQDFSWP